MSVVPSRGVPGKRNVTTGSGVGTQTKRTLKSGCLSASYVVALCNEPRVSKKANAICILSVLKGHTRTWQGARVSPFPQNGWNCGRGFSFPNNERTKRTRSFYTRNRIIRRFGSRGFPWRLVRKPESGMPVSMASYLFILTTIRLCFRFPGSVLCSFQERRPPKKAVHYWWER